MSGGLNGVLVTVVVALLSIIGISLTFGFLLGFF